MDPKSNLTSIPKRRGEDTQRSTQGRNPWKREVELGVMQLQAKEQRLEEPRKDSFPGPSEGVWPFQHLDFEFLASHAVKELLF